MWFLIPVVAVLGKMAYDMITDDDSSGSSSSSSSSETEEQKRREYQQQQRDARVAEMEKNICAAATQRVREITDSYASLSVKDVSVTMNNIRTFVAAKTDNADCAMRALAALGGVRIKLNSGSEKKQIAMLQARLEQVSGLVEQLTAEKEACDAPDA